MHDQLCHILIVQLNVGKVYRPVLSEIFIGHFCCPVLSEIFVGHFYRMFSNVVECYRMLSNVIKCYRMLSNVIECYQMLSNILRFTVSINRLVDSGKSNCRCNLSCWYHHVIHMSRWFRMWYWHLRYCAGTDSFLERVCRICLLCYISWCFEDSFYRCHHLCSYRLFCFRNRCCC